MQENYRQSLMIRDDLNYEKPFVYMNTPVVDLNFDHKTGIEIFKD